MTIRTILVDDESLAIQGLALRLQAHEDVEIVETGIELGMQEGRIRRPVMVDVDVEAIDGFSLPIERHRRQAEGHRHRRAERGAEAARGHAADRLAALGPGKDRRALADRGAALGAQPAAGAFGVAQFRQDDPGAGKAARARAASEGRPLLSLRGLPGVTSHQTRSSPRRRTGTSTPAAESTSDSAEPTPPWRPPSSTVTTSRCSPASSTSTGATGTTTSSIDMVSGATYTSTGYIQSLQSALDQAHI